VPHVFHRLPPTATPAATFDGRLRALRAVHLPTIDGAPKAPDGTAGPADGIGAVAAISVHQRVSGTCIRVRRRAAAFTAAPPPPVTTCVLRVAQASTAVVLPHTPARHCRQLDAR